MCVLFLSAKFSFVDVNFYSLVYKDLLCFDLKSIPHFNIPKNRNIVYKNLYSFSRFPLFLYYNKAYYIYYSRNYFS